MSVVCKKLSCPHGSERIGAETGFAADGCSALAAAHSRLVHNKNWFIMAMVVEYMARTSEGENNKSLNAAVASTG